MSQGRTAASAARSVGSGAARAVHAWRVLPHERRLAAGAALSLFATLFLPWYQETVIAPGTATQLQSATASVTGWGAFSFVEAAVLLVAVGVLTLLVQRAEGRAFHLPGGDGWVITLAGFWTCVLVIWRVFDKQGTSSHQQFATTSGIEWGIFVALAGAAFLSYAGTRIRAAHRPEPPLPGDAEAAGNGVIATAAVGSARAKPAQWRDEDAAPTAPRSGRRVRRPADPPGPHEAPADDADAAAEAPTVMRPAKPPAHGPESASDRRTGWLTARPEGWTEDAETARRAPTRGWSYDEAADEPRGRPAPSEYDEPRVRRTPPPEDDYDDEPPRQRSARDQYRDPRPARRSPPPPSDDYDEPPRRPRPSPDDDAPGDEERPRRRPRPAQPADDFDDRSRARSRDEDEDEDDYAPPTRVRDDISPRAGSSPSSPAEVEPDAEAPPKRRFGRRANRPDDDQLTIRLDHDD